MNDIRKQQELEYSLISGFAHALIIAFAVVCIVCAMIPFVLAVIYSWAWLIAYPVIITILVLIAPKKKN